MFLERFSTCCLKDFCSAMEANFSCVSRSSISCISWARYSTWSNSCFCFCSFVWYCARVSWSCLFSCCNLLIWTRRAFSSLSWLSCKSLKRFSSCEKKKISQQIYQFWSVIIKGLQKPLNQIVSKSNNSLQDPDVQTSEKGGKTCAHTLQKMSVVGLQSTNGVFLSVFLLERPNPDWSGVQKCQVVARPLAKPGILSLWIKLYLCFLKF